MGTADVVEQLQQRLQNTKQMQVKEYKTHYGVNRLADRLSLPDEYFYTLRNCYVSKENWIEQRNGYTRVTTGAITGAPKVRKLFEYQDVNGAKSIIGRGGTGWYKYNSSGIKDDAIVDGGMEDWTGSALDSWTLAGTDAVLAKESTIKHGGSFSAKVTRVGADASLYQDDKDELTHDIDYWKGRTVTATCYVYASHDVGDSTARISIYDGVTRTYSSYHTGDTTWQQLTVTATVDSSATNLIITCHVDNRDDSAYFDDAEFTDDETGGWVPIDIGRSSDAYGQMTQFSYYGVYADGGELRKFDSTFTPTNVDDTYAPSNVSCVHTHNHRLVCNDDDNPLSFYLSKVDQLSFNTSGGDAAAIDLSNVVPVGDKIIGFSTYLAAYLIIWLNYHIVVYFVPTTTTDITLQQMIRTGCLSYDGLIFTDSGDILYPNESGYKSFIQSYATQSIMSIKDETALINPYYRKALTSISDPRDIIGVHYHVLDHAYFKIPFSSDPELWIMSEDLKVATKGKGNIAGFYTGINPYSFLVTSSDELFFGGGDGHIYQMDDGTNDNGSAILFEAEKTGITFDNPTVYKKPKEMEIILEASGSVNLTLSYGFGISTGSAGATDVLALVTTQDYWDVGLWDVAKWDAAGQQIIRTRNLIGRGKYMNFNLSHNQLDVIVKFPYWIFRYFNMGVD